MFHNHAIKLHPRHLLKVQVYNLVFENVLVLYPLKMCEYNLFQQHLNLLVDRDPNLVRSCIQVLRPLLEAWRQVPNGTAEAAARERMHGSPTGADPAAPRPGGDGGLVVAPRANAPEASGGRPSLLSVSA